MLPELYSAANGSNGSGSENSAKQRRKRDRKLAHLPYGANAETATPLLTLNEQRRQALMQLQQKLELVNQAGLNSGAHQQQYGGSDDLLLQQKLLLSSGSFVGGPAANAGLGSAATGAGGTGGPKKIKLQRLPSLDSSATVAENGGGSGAAASGGGSNRSPFLAPASRKRKRQLAAVDQKRTFKCGSCGQAIMVSFGDYVNTCVHCGAYGDFVPVVSGGGNIGSTSNMPSCTTGHHHYFHHYGHHHSPDAFW